MRLGIELDAFVLWEQRPEPRCMRGRDRRVMYATHDQRRLDERLVRKTFVPEIAAEAPAESSSIGRREQLAVPQSSAARRARSRSAHRSATFSMPTDKRQSVGLTMAASPAYR